MRSPLGTHVALQRYVPAVARRSGVLMDREGASESRAADWAWAPQVRVLFVTSEFCGYLKAGGLGEVSAALPRALKGLCDIRVLMPGYPAVRRLHDDIE